MIANTPTDKGKHIADLRAAFEHRAIWFHNLIIQAEKRGLDMDGFARDAIRGCGCWQARNKFTATDDLAVFASEFVNENVREIFEMQPRLTPDTLEIDFHYCPLVAAWQKLGAEDELIAHLCDIAMDGDRGIIDEFPAFRFHLGKTIAKGDGVCQVCFSKK